MSTHIDELVAIASPALSESTPRLSAHCTSLGGPLTNDVLRLLWTRNGFFAFEGALHVYPSTQEVGVIDIERWNERSLWREAYDELTGGALFFAQDAFGGQFCIDKSAIWRFDPETAEREKIGDSVEEWAAMVLENPGLHTGWKLAHAWQSHFRALKPGMRLVPKTPFVLGGEFTIHNLHAVECVTAMRFYGELAVQLHNHREGARIQLRVVD
jgi:hypothetical protein